MRYIYCDLGAYNGDTFLSFMADKDLPAPAEEFYVYLFEPNPQFSEILHTLKDKFENIVSVSDKAAWISEGEDDLAQDTNQFAYGSTLMEGKKDIWDKFDKIKVQTFDFSEWVKQFEDDYLIVKMDIEGAEFPILEKMIKDGNDECMIELWVEMHPNKVREYTTTYSNELLETLRNRGIKVVEWH